VQAVRPVESVVQAKVAPTPLAGKGVLAAGLIITAWAALLSFLLAFYQPDWHSPAPYLLLLLQTHLYTGLYITGHDAMHGVVSPNKRLNNAIGTLATVLFAYNWFPRQVPKHHDHHRHVGFLPWLLRFAWNYVTWWQVVLMAITYNVLKIWFPQANVIAFWMIPAVLATLQLFFFGTYLPHRGEHEPDNRHKSRSQLRHHVWAFVSCYFFGYHYEHHDQPYLPWWRLWQTKSRI
jgi:beta-carotene ketolase (CrtW type)